jgi:hypothetical protein
VSCVLRTVYGVRAYYERRQRLAPITGPAPKPRVRNGAKKKDPFFLFPVIFPSLAHVMTLAGHARGCTRAPSYAYIV